MCLKTHSAAWLVLLSLVAVGPARGATLAELNYDRLFGLDATAFGFGDLSPESGQILDGGTYIGIDLQSDYDLENDFFGGFGYQLSPAQEVSETTARIDVTLRVDALNQATDFRVVLVDEDDPGVTGDEFVFFFDLTGVTPGSFVTLSQALNDPGPVAVQTQFDRDPGDMIQNYGLYQLQFQSPFGDTNRLKVDIETIQVIDDTAPVASWNGNSSKSFDFGTISETAGTLDLSGENIVIQTEATGAGGIAFNNPGFVSEIDFEAADHQLEIEAKLLPGNTAELFRVVMTDVDGDDSAPGLGGDDMVFLIDTSEFNAADFSTFTLPLGLLDGFSIESPYDFTNEGDGIQNFDLRRIALHSFGDDLGLLGIEIASVQIVPKEEGLDGDFNDDGMVDAADYTTWRDNLGQPAGTLPNDSVGGVIGDAQYDLWRSNYGASAPAPSNALVAAPEPAAAMLLLCASLAGVRTRFRV